MDNGKLEEVSERLLSVIEERFESKKEGAKFLVKECGFDLTPGTLVEKLRGKATMRLREFLRIADALGLDYR